jgi:hypothetical protein
MAPKNDIDRELTELEEALCIAIAVRRLGPAAAYRVATDCRRMKSTSVSSNAKRVLRRPRVKARLAQLRARTPAGYAPDYPRQAQLLTKLGATILDLAEFFQVGLGTLSAWQTMYAEFGAACRSEPSNASFWTP